MLDLTVGKPIEKPKVFVVMPRYGDVALGAARGFVAPNTRRIDPEFHVDIAGWSSCSTSSTPHCFNTLLAEVLDARDAGLVTHMAMIHSDVEPIQNGWVNRLWVEMVSHKADLVSAVVAIKEPGRLNTSTAVGSISDPWVVKRYVTLKDRETLPDTFSGSDVCRDPDEVLLVNTGLFLADVRKPWWDDFAFEFVTTITKDDKGRRKARFRPEDWELSRHLHRSGAKVCATWALAVDHRGQSSWPNYPEPSP